jgi:Ca-activated chloride channel family protein
MLSFSAPLALIGLPLALAVAGVWQRRRFPAITYPSLTLLDGLPRGRARLASLSGWFLRGATLVLLVLAAAGPRWPDRATRIPAEGICLILAIDVSGSMAEAIPGSPLESRLSRARKAFREFVHGEENGPLPGRPGDRIGIVAFAAWPETVCPLTLNHAVLLSLLDDLAPKSGPDAGTNIGDAIAESLNRLESAGRGRKVIILLSDGEHNIALNRADPPLRPRQAAQLAANLHVPIYSVDCAGDLPTDATADQRQQRAEGRATLLTVADMTGGQFFSVDGGTDWPAVYREIDRLERTPVESYSYRRYREFAPWCAGAAIVAFVMLRLLEGVVWRALP